MNTLKNCLLCNGEVDLFYKEVNKHYYKCKNCNSVMLDPADYISGEKEKMRYQTHNNDIKDVRYQKFVSPIVDSVKTKYDTSHLGLDFGAGTGPVITSELEKLGYKLNLYDPYFHNYPDNLKINYDYIVVCEVMEHFYNPYAEFEKLSKMLNAEGSIFCMTEIYDDSIDFASWYYKNDDTHVFLYHKKAIEWIKSEFKFSKAKIDKRLITFSM